MRRSLIAATSLMILSVLTHAVGANAQICPAEPGTEIPAVAREIRESDPEAYAFGRAWLGVTERAAAVRAEIGESALARGAASTVSGNYQVPVFAIQFSDTAVEPWAPAALEQRLFDGQGASLTDYYSEISGNRVNVSGAVFGWTTLANPGSYYAGVSNGLNPGDAKVGELIRDTLLASDAGIDFGQYDNDGPDGIPNSGDDDGYVDFVAFVHPDFGAECGGENTNIWSHRWRYPAWSASGGIPFATDDASANGGSILVDDYVIQPGLACGGAEMIEIGVFCHEFGHAFGLPDLYDTNGGGAAGLGHWCLMAAGNWNDPDQPAHMSAWTKRELGWVTTVDVDWQGATVDVEPVATSETIYRLSFRDDRWNRRSDCAITGTTSLAVGLSSVETSARGWIAPEGYGNGWNETVAHDFRYDGVGSVTLDYDYAIDSEGGFDFGFVILEVGGTEFTLAVYDGIDSGSAQYDLTPWLSGGAQDYRIKFRFRSDGGWSNEDGNYAAACAPFVIDAITINGGGASHAADFELHRDGWYCPRNEVDNPTSEFWLAENRQKIGFDAQLHGEGLLLYHVDQEVMKSSLGNSGGATDLATRGVVIEEADAGDNLLTAAVTNRGDDGDPWPGSSLVTQFDSTTTPAADSNDGVATGVSIQNLEVIGDVVRVTWSAGDPAPAVSSLSVATAAIADGALTVDLVGAANIEYGATVRLVRSGFPSNEGTDLQWLDHDRVSVTLAPGSGDGGIWDVVIENPDGQNVVLDGGFAWTNSATDAPAAPRLPSDFALEQNFPNPFNPRTVVRFAVPRPSTVQLRVFDVRGRLVSTLVDRSLDEGQHEVVWDGTDDAGRRLASGIYFARMQADGFSAARKMLLSQ